MKLFFRFCALCALLSTPALADDIPADEPAESASRQDAASPEIQAEESADAVLDEFVVTAFRVGESDPLSQALNSTYIGRDKIEESAALNVIDVLEKQANVRFRSVVGSNATGDLSMRGFGENSQTRILVMVDGQRFNRPDMGAINWLQIPLSDVESIEVLRGPMSALYGASAEAGVIKIKTRRPAEDGYSFFGEAVYGSYSTYNLAARASGREGDWFFSAGVNDYQTDGWRENSEAWARSANVSLGYDINEKNSLVFSGSYTKSYIEYPGPLSWEQYVQDPRQSDGKSQSSKSDDGIFALNLETESTAGSGEVGLAANFRDIYWQTSSNSRNTQWTATFTPRYRFDVGENSHILAGFDGTYEDVDFKRYYQQTPYTHSFADAQRYSFSPYLGADTTLFEKLTISAAGRFDAACMDAHNTEYFENSILPTRVITVGGKRYEIPNPDYGPTVKSAYDESKWQHGFGANFGANYSLREDTSVFFKFDQIYHYPSIDEVAAYQGYTMALPFNFDLEPETGQNYEIGAKYFSDGWTVVASAFLQYLDNEISFDNTQNINVNLPPTRRYGIDAQISYDSQYYGASIMFTAVRAEFDGGAYSGRRVPLVPDFYGSAAVYVKPLEWIKLTFRANLANSQYEGNDNSNTARMIPAYATFDFQASFNFCRYGSIFASIENAFDKRYVSCGWSGTYYPGMGRMMKIGLNLKF